MFCVTVDGTGAVVAAVPTETSACENLILISVDEFAGAYSQITPQEVLTSFSWGFGVVVLFWSFGYAVGVATGMIRKA